MTAFSFKSLSICLIILLLLSCNNETESDLEQTSINCNGQIALSVSEFTGTSATINWNTSENFSSYEIEYGIKGFTQGQGTKITFNFTVAELNDLNANTEYDVYVRGRCSNESSIWFGPVSFTTLCDAGIYVGDVLLTTQDEVNAFTALCYSSIEGDLMMVSTVDDPSGIADLSGFSGLTEVLGGVTIKDNNLLTNLEGLEGLKRVINFRLDSNTNLQSLNGLRNLEEFIQLPNEQFYDRTLQIENTGIASLTGLEKIKSLQNLIISRTQLTSLEGLDNLESVSRTIGISVNPNLESLIGLQSVQTVGEFVSLEFNAALTSLSGFENLLTVGQAIRIANNESLNSIEALSNLVDVDRIEIEDNPMLSSLTGVNFSSIEFLLQIINNDGLVDFNGLQFNENTSAFLEVKNCDGITTMSGLEGLTDTFGLEISENQNLSSLSGLQNITICRNQIFIQSNPVLDNFCALTDLIQNEGLQGGWITEQNAYNPTFSQMQLGQCIP